MTVIGLRCRSLSSAVRGACACACVCERVADSDRNIIPLCLISISTGSVRVRAVCVCMEKRSRCTVSMISSGQLLSIPGACACSVRACVWNNGSRMATAGWPQLPILSPHRSVRACARACVRGTVRRLATAGIRPVRVGSLAQRGRFVRVRACACRRFNGPQRRRPYVPCRRSWRQPGGACACVRVCVCVCAKQRSQTATHYWPPALLISISTGACACACVCVCACVCGTTVADMTAGLQLSI
jgi:hypothetical protein